MFGISKIQRLEDNIKVLHKEIRSLQKQFLNKISKKSNKSLAFVDELRIF